MFASAIQSEASKTATLSSLTLKECVDNHRQGIEIFPRGLMEMKSSEDAEGSSQLFYAFTNLYSSNQTIIFLVNHDM